MSCNIQEYFQNLFTSLSTRLKRLEGLIFEYTTNLKISPEAKILFSTSKINESSLAFQFNGKVDTSISDYVFSYKFPNPTYYMSVLGSIYYQNRAFPAKNYIKIVNRSDGIDFLIRLPDTTLKSGEQVFQFDILVNDDTSSTGTYPAGFEINGYFFWQGNFVGSSPTIQYYCTEVSAAQTSYQAASNCVSGSGTFTYNGNTIPSGFNSIFLFTGYSNAASALANLTNYTTGGNMLTIAQNYLQPLGSGNYLLSLCLGGGVASTGGWSTGSSGAVYSVYQAATNSGASFSYKETGTGNTLTGTGTGILNNTYNSLLFDIETWSGNSGSTGTDFINLFNYLKTNSNSTFYTFKCIIIVSVAHSCSNYNGTGQSVVSTLLSDSTGSYDYFQTQMYTENVGTTNEYCANYNILWTGSTGFAYYLSQNANYNTYGNTFLLPAINFANLYTGPGTNTPENPNLYFYQSSGNATNPITETASGYITIPYNTDTGVNAFFQAITGISESIGGYVQWVNGTV